MVIAPDNPSKQNKIFRQLGIDGFNDQGSGTIHPSEQYQAVFFKPQTLQKIKVLDNVLHKSLVGKQPLQKYPKEIINLDIQNKNAIEKYTNYIMRNNKTQDIEDIDSKYLILGSKERDKTAKFIIKNKKYLNDNDVYNLLSYATDKDEIAKLLGSENINKLSDKNVYDLLRYAKNPDEMAEFIIQYKTYLNDYSVFLLLSYATNKDEIAKLLGKENINKLSDRNVNYFLNLAENPDEMRRILKKYGRIQ
jgi:hypothetical protein